MDTIINALCFDTETSGLFKNNETPYSLLQDELDLERPVAFSISWATVRIVVDSVTGVVKPRHTKIGKINDVYLNWESVEGDEAPVVEDLITKLTGITKQKLKTEGIDPIAAIDLLAKEIKNCNLIVAHNLNYDMSILTNSLIRLGVSNDDIVDSLFCIESFCTSHASAVLYGTAITSWYGGPKHVNRLSLQKLYKKFFGKEFENAHTSAADTLALSNCLIQMVNTHNREELQFHLPAQTIVDSIPIDALKSATKEISALGQSSASSFGFARYVLTTHLIASRRLTYISYARHRMLSTCSNWGKPVID